MVCSMTPREALAVMPAALAAPGAPGGVHALSSKVAPAAAKILFVVRLKFFTVFSVFRILY
jgi:hypothetical protein